MRLRAFLLTLLLIMIVLPLPTHGDSGNCSGAPPIRLAVGVTARTTLAGTPGVRLRENPGERFRRVATLREGILFNVVAGPTCSDSMQWWQVRDFNGLSGWLSEGDETTYQIEPWPVALEIAQRTNTGVRLVQIRASDGTARILNSFPIKPVPGSVRDVFPQAEWQPLQEALDRSLARCPASTPLRSLDDLPADTNALDVYPSPDNARLVIIRHLWHSQPGCAAGPSPVYGIDRLSLVTPGGETPLFDVAANAPGPIYLDRFSCDPQHLALSARSRIEGVWWSPDNRRVLLLIRYADVRDPALPVFTYKVLVYDLQTSRLTNLGDGLHPAWDLAGERVQWFRRISPGPGQAPEEALYSAQPDGSDLRGIPLPRGMTFVSPRPSDDLGLPWNDTGTQVVGCTLAGSTGQTMCSTIAAFDLNERRLSVPIEFTPALQAHGYRKIQWLNDSTLAWLPTDPTVMLLNVLSIQTRSVTTLHLKPMGNSRLVMTDAKPFPDGKSVLVTIRDEANAVSYLVVNVETGKVIPVHE
jgi:hypothetical protein